MPILDVPALLYVLSLTVSMLVQVVAIGFGVASAIALFRKPPACHGGGSLAATSLYLAVFAFAIPAFAIVLIAGACWSSPAQIRTAMPLNGRILAQAAIFTLPACSIAVVACFASHLRLRAVPPVHAALLWYGSTGNLVVGAFLVMACIASLLLLSIVWS
jgi:hypothetical protein